MKKRAVILSTIFAFLFLVVIFRLADIMLLNHGRFVRSARSQQTINKELLVGRGNIYDSRGRELAVNIEADSVYCNPQQIPVPENTARVISATADLDYASLLKVMSSDKGFVWIKRKMNPEFSDKIRALNIQGVSFKPETKRFYPNGMLASHIIGTVGLDNQPLEGIEIKYDETLTKRGGSIEISRDAKGRQMSDGNDTQLRGNSLVLTIDEGLQYIVEEELDHVMEKWKSSRAVAIMMNPYTGEILAMASRPTYNPNSPADFDNSERRNRAITDLYEPGSTFKLITAAGALEKGVVTPDTPINCKMGSIKVGKWTLSDVHKLGVIPFKDVIKKSSNVGSITVGLKLGYKELHNYARNFGFSEKTGIDLPGEASGWIGRPDDKSEASTATLSIGYGVAVTPLQVLRAYSAIANRGMLPTPYLVSEIRTPEGEIISAYNPPTGRRAVSAKTADTIKEILMSVTENGGTAEGASIEGNRVAGKTGTARLREPGKKGYSGQKYTSSFVGFVPAENPKVALIVVVYEPKGGIYGGLVAAPAFKGIAEKALTYMNVPRDDMKEKNTLVVKVDVKQ